MGKVNYLPSLFSMTDEQAMWRVQTQDDHRAFVQLLERWEEPIGRLCARMTGDLHRGEDLKQETFARVFEKRKSFQPNARFSTWLWRIALNLCYDEMRRINRRGESPLDADGNATLARLDEFAAETPTPDAQMAEREEGELVRRALLQLPEIYRGVLVLRHYENLKLREIAEILEIPEGTVNSRLAEGLAQLTRILEPQFDERRGRQNQVRRGQSVTPKEFHVPQPGGATVNPPQAPPKKGSQPADALSSVLILGGVRGVLDRQTGNGASAADSSSPSTRRGLQMNTANL
jgi:RNA polymerase sigma-70 factor (ECF subfamily)